MQGRPRLLLVEDSDDTRVLLSVALGHDGWTVDEAADAFQGAALLARNRYDLVLADYDLPGKTGAVMIREAAEAGRLHDAKVVVVTAHPDPQGVEDLEVIRKPLDLPTFLHQMRQIRGGTVTARSAEKDAVVDLVLYVSAHSLASARALEILKAAIRDASPGVRLTVCDLASQPGAGDADNVVFTPTLVKRQPLPRMWILGDLTRPQTVTDLLQSFRPTA